MSALDVIAFDADDTLWHCESLFQATQVRLADIPQRHAPHDKVEAHLHETESRNIRLLGYGIKGFSLSMIETAAELSGQRVTASFERHDTTPDYPCFHRLDRIADVSALIDGL